MKNMVLSILNVFKGDKNSTIINAGQKLTNQKLLNEFISIFDYKLKELSVGDKMLYPMSFSIIMHSADYSYLRETLHFVVGQAVCQFGQIISDYTDTYPDYTPPANTWYFQISPSLLDTIPIGDEDVLEIKQGEIHVLETGVYSYNKDEDEGVSVDDNIRVSVRVKNSNVYKNININRETLTGFNTLSEGIFSFPFDSSLKKSAREIVEESNVNSQTGLAELSYISGGSTYKFTIKANTTDISGKDEMRKGKSIFKIEETSLSNQHLQIRYVPETKSFQIAAYAPARLNGRKMDISSSNNPLWRDLEDGSSIFANEEVKLSFKVK